MTSREEALKALSEETFDLLIIGGGITGMATAREGAGRGLKVALVEAHDYASGTSSRSTKLIHGGIRYLKDRQFRLVKETVSERMALLEGAPHLVRPLWFLFPVYRGDPDPLPLLWLGMWLYDRYAGKKLGTLRHRRLGAKQAVMKEPLLRSQDLLGAGLYMDAVTDDGRLTVTVMKDARRRGAKVVNRAPVVGFIKEEGKIRGAVVEDALSGEKIPVKAGVVLNASGPWADEVRRLDEEGAEPLLLLAKGIHLAVPYEKLPLRQAVVMRGKDGRIMFAIPRLDYTYAGTTDTPYEGDLRTLRATGEEVAYVLEAMGRMFPEANVGPGDVVSTWAGVRPLVAPKEGVPADAVSRDYQLFKSPSGLVTVGGGKLTAHQAMARHIVSDLFPATRRSPLQGAPLPGGDRLPAKGDQELWGKEHHLPLLWVEKLVWHFGGEVPDVLAFLPKEGEAEERVAEAVTRFSLKKEDAFTVEDVLARRFPMALFSQDQGRGMAEKVAQVLAEERTLSQKEKAELIDGYGRYVKAMEAWREEV
ncbi:MAG: glycerol-3-phosphate dehydrogenase/oxidase [Bacillota bacterium]|nr:glycerol-3-phosphate dehydrogenase/oxidase [Bacillota bacterium]